jgi:hypothetical protein
MALLPDFFFKRKKDFELSSIVLDWMRFEML